MMPGHHVRSGVKFNSFIKKGYDIGAVDGLIGDKTRQAIRQEQQRLGLNPTGRAGQQILRALRAEYIMQ